MEKLLINDNTMFKNQTIKFFEDFIHLLSDGVIVTDLSQNIILANKMFCSFFNLKYGEMIETNLYDWLNEFGVNAMQQWEKIENELQVNGYCKDVELTISIDNVEKYFYVSASFTQQPTDSASLGFTSIWHDITEQIVNERKIRHLASFPKMDINPILEINSLGEVTYCNDAAINVLQELCLDKDIRVFLPTDMKELYKSFAKKCCKQTYREVEIGNRIFAEWLYFVPEFNVIRIYTADISDRKKREDELAMTQNQLLHNEKLSAIGKLSASIAHEFNNPICGIRSVLESISKEGIDKSNKRIKLVDLAINDCDRMADLIRKLRDFYRPSQAEYHFLNINKTIDDVITIYNKRLQERGIKLKKNYGQYIPNLECVGDQIKQVILNIIQNADDAITGKDDLIKITTSVNESNSHVLIEISDNGNGICPENMKSLFEPFFTTKSSVKGTGLGLPICYGIVKKHKGDIKVDSIEGEGTTFTIILPLNRRCN